MGTQAAAKAVAIVLIGLSLTGCATLTAVTIGTAIGIGLATGIGKFAGEQIARSGWRRHIAYRRCKHLQNDYPRLQQCVASYTGHNKKWRRRS